MFRLHKTRPAAKSSSGEKIGFKLSCFKALQVPKGWDKLFVSIISVETGKTIVKTSKAGVRNGNCQWSETLTESIWTALQDESSKELEDCLFKFVVATGSARSGILGEVTVNMASYMSSNDPLPVSFPLKKCNHGTVLQKTIEKGSIILLDKFPTTHHPAAEESGIVKIQCLTPRTKLIRDDESKETYSHKEDINVDTRSHEVEIKSEEFNNSLTEKIEGSYSSTDLSYTAHRHERGKTEASFSNSDSHHSYDTAEGFTERDSFSPSNKLSGDEHPLNSVPQGRYPVDNPSESNHSSFKSRIRHSENLSQEDPQEFAASPLRISGSSKSLLEAAEDTIEELRNEAKMWERNARKLMLDLEILRKDYSEQSKNQANLYMELSAACAECDGLQKEVEQLKLLEKSTSKPAAVEDYTLQDEGATHFIKELENDVMFQKESNANLGLQLKRSQESNVELVAVLQELEEIIEKQKNEIENLSALQSKFSDMENSIQINLEKNRNLMLHTQQLQESEKNLQAKVQALEQALEEKKRDTENQSLNDRNFLEMETEYKCKLTAKEKEIVSLKAKLSEALKKKHYSTKMESITGGDGNLIREIEELQVKLQELENDCQELTDENLELLLKLKQTIDSSTDGVLSSTSLMSEGNNQDSQMEKLEEKMKKKLLREIENDHNLSVQEIEILKSQLEVEVAELNMELGEKWAEIERLQASLLSKEEENGNLQRYQRELEAKLSVLHNEKGQIEERMEIVTREGGIATKCLNDLRKDLMVLSSSVDSHVSANKILETRSSELASSKQELEIRLSELKQENEELSAHITVLEGQLTQLTDERESTGLELENSKTHVRILQDQVARLTNEVETQRIDMKQNLQQLHDQWSETQEECDYLKRDNLKLQASAESIMQECSSLQKSNGEFEKQKLELQQHCTHLEARLTESDRRFADCSRRVLALEENISSVLEDSASKEKNLTADLDTLLEENGKQNKRYSLLNQMYLEKMFEVENLQREVGDLAKQLSAIQLDRERIASEAVDEVSGLCAVIAKLESELNTAQVESNTKVQNLMDELAASKHNQEMLKVDNGRMSKLLTNYKSCEEKFKTTLSNLELKLTVSEYERQQVMEESTKLKVQSLEIGSLQDEVVALKNELNAIKSEKEKLEASFCLVSGECKELRIERSSFIEKIAILQKGVSELEDSKQKILALEEKLLRREGDLMAKEAFCEQYAEINSELTRIKRANKHLQQQMRQVEDDKLACLTRTRSLEEELIFLKEQQQKQGDSERKNSCSNQQQEGDYGYKIPDGSHPDGIDPASKIRSLEEDLAKALEENNSYKHQLKRLKSEGRKNYTRSPRKPTIEGEVVPKEKFERTKSSLESELRDIQERYFHMSLKYAEVEAKREELVMKLKTSNSGKRWL
ncbi:unnamed protein product [Dovyalis caffra]|uniref:C2 NT-type domain-containing protein n=1 Tax=Dovyalis caffra TaxID=77055 RepID=A0AAV1S2X0_9ROSI|nr:unnamed protein product [Dovyalis caffra]